MSYQSKAKLPRGAGLDKQIAFQKNAMKKPKTMKGYRYGFRLMWLGDPKFMTKIGMRREGDYDKCNQHGGVMFALPGEFKLTSRQAAHLLYRCYRSKKFTMPQMEQIKKTLAYAYMLQGGATNKNFDSIPGIWEVVTNEGCHEQKLHVLPTRIPTPEELKRAFTTQTKFQFPFLKF